MQLRIEPSDATPRFQQIINQLRFAISSGELAAGDALPSIRSVAKDLDVAANTVVKAYRQLEFRGLIESRDRSGYQVQSAGPDSRYGARGVSAAKTEVHGVVDHLDAGLFPRAFCKVTEDYLTGDPDKCNVIHADGAGTKSIVAYLQYRETGDASVFRGIAQDSIVMNLDDLLCVGVGGRILISNTINRNALNCPGEVIAELIDGGEAFLANLRDHGVAIYSGGGETADVGDLTGSIVVDSCAVSVMRKADVLESNITPELAIVGLSSTGQASFEDSPNSGIGSNGLTSARHDMLSPHYKQYAESFDPNVDPALTYCGPYRLGDPLPDSEMTVGDAILSPTRSYAPVIYRLLQALGREVRAIIHCSGGAQTKCTKFAAGIHFVKDNLFPVPPLFDAIRRVSNTSGKEMHQVFNMGHRMEVYVPPKRVNEVIDVAASFNIHARQVGYTEAATATSLTLYESGNAHTYAT